MNKKFLAVCWVVSMVMVAMQGAKMLYSAPRAETQNAIPMVDVIESAVPGTVSEPLPCGYVWGG